MNDTLHTIVNKIYEHGGRPLAVGGFVRDTLLGLQPKDIDIEVHNMPADVLVGLLSDFGKVDTVGVSFGVIKLWTADGDFDFSLPRRDNKTGQGHKGFQVEVDPSMTIIEAASRRDFTINSMALDLVTQELIDPFNGKIDLEARVLLHTSPTFSEDPLRVLRGMQFAGRFDMLSSPSTDRLCSDLMPEFHTLAEERVWGEWEKWALKSVKPSAGLLFLADTDWIELFPELLRTQFCPQEPEWHPEGDVWDHTLHVVDAMAAVCERDGVIGTDRVVRMFGALCHDFGKPSTTVKNDVGRWISPGHAQAGEEPTLMFLERIGMPVRLHDRVVECVREHMAHVDFNGSKRTVRRLLSRLKAASIHNVMAVIEADHSGRPPLPTGMPWGARHMMEIANEMGNEVKPIVMGRHLIELGVAPGPAMGELLRQAFEAQLDGVFDNLDDGLLWIRAGALATKWEESLS